MFLGENILAWLTLAFGVAMAVGSAAALLRPPERRQEGDLPSAPVGRTVAMIAVGTVVALWALASLLAG